MSNVKKHTLKKMEDQEREKDEQVYTIKTLKIQTMYAHVREKDVK